MRSYLAWVPTPPTATGQMVRRSAKRGEIAARSVKCPTCKGERKHRVRGMLVACTDCPDEHGNPSGRVMVDPFTGRRPADNTGFRDEDARHRQANLRDGEIARIEATIRQHDGLEAAPDAYMSAYDRSKRLNGQGSFPALERALRVLRDVDETAYHVVWAALVYGPFGPPVGRVREGCAAICELLATWMPERIVVPGWARSSADWPDKKSSLWRGRSVNHQIHRTLRRIEIRLAEGSNSELAATYGLSERRIRQLRAEQQAPAA